MWMPDLDTRTLVYYIGLRQKTFFLQVVKSDSKTSGSKFSKGRVKFDEKVTLWDEYVLVSKTKQIVSYPVLAKLAQ